MKPSKVTEQDWKYPLPEEPNAQGMLAVDAIHTIRWKEYGNPQGEPVIFLHGGPGAGTSPRQARFFDPHRYRIISFDQRGCGESKPHVADDVEKALTHNTTNDLIGDIEKLRKARNITGKMHVFGGSWGSTLALAYAIAHPEHVATLILRGVFLCRKKDINYFNQGNAASYHINPLDSSTGEGAYMHYPEAWKSYVEAIPVEERHDMIAAYNRILTRQPASAEDLDRRNKLATIAATWEGASSYLVPELPATARASVIDPYDLSLAILEAHYFMHGAFLEGENRNQNYILENAHRITAPVYIVHGQHDQVCPIEQAEVLTAKLKSLGKQVDYKITNAGHSMFEAENARALTAIMDSLPALEAPRQQPATKPAQSYQK
jgi:proline iminopeptidase